MRQHPSGNYMVEGRKKDLINRGGEKISAEEVENLILSHPSVKNVACIPVPDPYLGERMCACVLLRDGGRLDFDELKNFLQGKEIAKFKIPERLEVLPDFPLSADFPNLTIVAAHPGWPWVDEMTAVVLHKGNVFWELSGWAPKYFPTQLKTDVRGRLKDKIMFGSDYPSIPYDRLLREWGELGYKDDIMERVFHGNAERVLGL